MSSSLGSARGGKRVAAPLMLEVVRPLTSEDLPMLVSPPPVGSLAPSVSELRHSHHQLAQLLASGTSAVKASLITGYSQSRISILRSDPAFAELTTYYANQKEQIFLDVLERMKVLGLSSLDELQAQLESNPAGWSKRELMELAELMLVKGRAGPGSSQGASAAGAAGSAGVVVNVQFATMPAPQAPPVIDGKIDA